MSQVSLSQMVSRLMAVPTLVSFPTDTVPALATKPEHADLIYAAKRRPPEKPLILMGASFDGLCPYVLGSDAELTTWRQLTSQHWPGQLTLVLPASDLMPASLNPQRTGSLGIRVPNHPVALALLSRTGPLATTSANLSGQLPLIAIADITRTFPTALMLQADTAHPTTATSQTPSTVIKWTGHSWETLRQGLIKV